MTDHEIALFAQLAKGIAKQFGDKCEVLVHDLSATDVEKTVIAIENGHISGRHLGDGPSQIVWEALQADPATLQDRLAYLTKTKDGKLLRSSTIFLRRTALVTFSIICPAASRRDAEPEKTGVTNVLPVLESSSLAALSLTS